jgi:hypothetical protein
MTMLDALGPDLWTATSTMRFPGGVRLHHRFPDATLLGAPGLAEKRRDLAFDGTTSDAPWGDALTAHQVAGAPRLNEVVFHHPASRTLITTDLVFNIREPANRRTSLVLRLMGTRGRLARSREWGFLTRDRAAHRDSVDRILALPFDRVLMAHGEPVEGDGRGELARALSRA